MSKLIVLIFVWYQAVCALPPHEVFIIVPGTWAIKEKWYTVGGDFFSALQESVQKSQSKVLWFRWLSGNQEKDRKTAAREFAHMLRCFEPTTEITIIAHSHGVNVTLGACQLLAKVTPMRKIKTLYALAAPIHEEAYSPNMHVITRLYNLYSLNDAIQTIWGYQRIFTAQPGIINLRVFIENKEPNHSEIHSPLIGQWLTTLAQKTCPPVGTVYFSSIKPPAVTYNPNCEKELAQEKPIDFQTLLYIRKNKKNITEHEARHV